MIDITPKQIKIIPAEKEIVLPELFQDTPGQIVGGWNAGSGQLTQGKVSIQANTERILIGDASEPMTGKGIFLGKDGDNYEMRVGDPAGYYMHFDGSDLNYVGKVSGRLTSVLAAAIDSAGHFIDSILDTATKQILGDFTFGASGAIKMITDDNNGLWLSPTGILGKKAGVTTFAIDILGNATFAGTLSAAAGTLGTITAGTLTGLTINTGASGKRIVIGALDAGLQLYNTDGISICLIQPTDSGTLLSAISPNTANRMFQFINFVQNGYNSNPMMYLEAADVDVGTIPLEIQQKGNKSAIKILHPTVSSVGKGIEIEHKGDGILGDFYLNKTTAVSNAVKIVSTGVAYALSVTGRIGAIFGNTQSAGSYAGYFKQDSKISGSPPHFSRLLQLETDSYSLVIFMSDRTSPDTLLVGAIGDICLNGDGGKIYYCTGETAWTAL